MTAKEKAHELVDDMDFSNYDKAKQCALICVDDKIEFIKQLPISDMMKQDLVAEQLLIQQEIEKL